MILRSSGAVCRDVGIQQIQRQRAPPARARLARTPDRPARSTSTTTGLPSSGDECQRQIMKVVVFVGFLLPARLAQVLAEISLLIEQPDADQRHAQVAGRLQMIARQNAQARRRRSTGIRSIQTQPRNMQSAVRPVSSPRSYETRSPRGSM